MKLHLGCSKKKIYGFTNVDIRPEVEPDLMEDSTTLKSIKRETVDLIYASHILEHTKDPLTVLVRWREILKPGGELYVAVPDMGACILHYIQHKDLNIIHSFIWGGAKNDYDFHYTGFDEKRLADCLFRAGFRSIKKYDWRQTDWAYIDDYSQAYLPHLDKINGVLLSLNMVATK